MVVGVDPGVARTGYGVVEADGQRCSMLECGCIETPSDMETGERLEIIWESLGELFRKHTIHVVALERLFFTKNVTSAISVAQARGVILLRAARSKIPVKEFGPRQVKQVITGYGAADKLQMQRTVAMLLGLKRLPEPDDSADALALALAGAICSSHSPEVIR
ncbi:MAG TPA: crossover junction endodeoxyribonuclease RuvC [Firmicutes bacterium]|nr:crossover junction endodeoxyribonuclease RuvC [Bacillota bacterium]